MNMRNTLITIGLLFTLSTANTMAQEPVEITGSMSKKENATVRLFKTVAGKLVEISSYTPDTNGNFFMGFYPEQEGIYVIGTGKPESRVGNYKFYFKKGDKLSINLTDSVYTLIGDQNSVENKIMEKWQLLSNPLYQMSSNAMATTAQYKRSTFMDFFPQLEEIKKQSEELLKTQQSGNKKFDQLMEESMKWDLALYAATYNLMPRSFHPSKEEYPDFYDKLVLEEYGKSAAAVYRQPWAFLTMNNIQVTNSLRNKVKADGALSRLANDISSIPNDTLKGDFVLQYAKRIKTLKGFQELFGQYGQYVITKSQQKEKDRLLSPYSKEQGSDAFNFSLPDQNGKTVSMTSLKGKVVLIDFWATWCAPCLYELPFTQKLEEQLKGTDFVVVGISIDEDKNKQKWKDMIKEKKIGGIQLFASGFGEVAQFYQVTTIPRYLVIDRDGKIVSSNSPRPSNPDLKALLEKTLSIK